MSDQKLYALFVPGPDEVWAMPSRKGAEEAADKHNLAMDKAALDNPLYSPLCEFKARACEWMHSAEEHAESMRDEEPYTTGDLYAEDIPHLVDEPATPEELEAAGQMRLID